MDEDKKLSGRDKYRGDRCFVVVAVCLSTLSILLAIACGISVVSMRDNSLEYEARLKRLEDQCGSGHKSALKATEERGKDTLQDVKVTEKAHKIGNIHASTYFTFRT